MELVLLAVTIFIVFFIISASLVPSIIITLIYSKSYHDGSETKGTRKWTLFRYLAIWDLLRTYVSFEIRDSVDNSKWKWRVDRPGNKVIYACHPHGLIPLGPLLAFGALSERYFSRKPNTTHPRLHIHRLLFAIPLLRDVLLWLGCMDVSETALRDRLSANLPVALVPSGSRGIIGGDINTETKHQGFIRLAYEYKTPVVSCWTPEEARIFKTWDLFPWLRRWTVSITGYPFPTPFIGPLPFRKLIMYMGNPVDPTEYDTLESFGKAYREQLQGLMLKYR